MFQIRGKVFFKSLNIRGFTLAELMITIGVIAVISASVVALIGTSPRAAARDGRRQADVAKLTSALVIYRNDQGFYPICTGGATSCSSTVISGLVPNYIPTGQMPVDPITTSTRIYRYFPQPSGCNNTTTRCTTFTLCSSLEKSTANLDASCDNNNCGSSSIHCANVVNP